MSDMNTSLVLNKTKAEFRRIAQIKTNKKKIDRFVEIANAVILVFSLHGVGT